MPNERKSLALKFEQDLSKDSMVRVAILQGKNTEESSVRTIESKGFLRSPPLPRGYQASAPLTLALRPEKIHLLRAGSEQINLERETGFEPATSTLARSHSTTELLPLDGKIIPHLRFPKTVTAVPVIAEVRDYANSNSIFFAARSRFTIRKLRTCPARLGSALGDPPPPLFQRACSIELKAERSAFDSCGASIFILAGVAAVILQEA